MKFEKTKTLNVLEFFCLYSLMSMIWSKILLHIDTPEPDTLNKFPELEPTQFKTSKQLCKSGLKSVYRVVPSQLQNDARLNI